MIGETSEDFELSHGSVCEGRVLEDPLDLLDGHCVVLPVATRSLHNHRRCAVSNYQEKRFDEEQREVKKRKKSKLTLLEHFVVGRDKQRLLPILCLVLLVLERALNSTLTGVRTLVNFLSKLLIKHDVFLSF